MLIRPAAALLALALTSFGPAPAATLTIARLQYDGGGDWYANPIYHIVYDFPAGLPKVHEHDGKPARGFGIFIGNRLAVFYSYESDLGNGWEDPGTYSDPPTLHESALRMGVNLFVYAVTSRQGT